MYDLKHEIWSMAKQLFPLCRSLTGNGVRQTFAILQEHLPIKIHEIPSGTAVFDWTIPPEWNISDAYIKDSKGNRIVDFQKNNLHVVGYSIPFKGKLSLKELEPHLHSLPEQPEAIPYVTSYYKPTWGFCLTEKTRATLQHGINYEVCIDATLAPGSLTYADLLIPGISKQEILISTYICHPSMANNELSGPIIAAFLAKILLGQKNCRYSYRFVFVPETIGSIAYLSKNKDHLIKNVIAGYVVTCAGDPAPFSYLPSRLGNTLTDKITKHVLKCSNEPFKLYSYLERGSDERQYCWPGIDLPVGSLMRSKYGTYPEYHTSLDDLSFITPEALEGSIYKYLDCFTAIESNQVYECIQLCEPQLGKRGLYPTLSTPNSSNSARIYCDFMAYADGKNDLLAIADILNCSIFSLIPVANTLVQHGLIKLISPQSD